MSGEQKFGNSSRPAEAYRRIAVFGAGAVGGFFGAMLARAGVDVTLIVRPATAEKIQRDGLFLDSIHFQEAIRVRAASDASAVRGADLILFCVKTLDTETAAKALAPHLDPVAVVVSLQNGVENVARMRNAAGIDAIAAVVYVAASVPEPGRVKHAGRGDLVIGVQREGNPAAYSERSDTLARISATFALANVPCKISPNIDAELWSKLILNCAGNSVTAIAQCSYGAAAREPHSRELMRATAREAADVAHAVGIELDAEELIARGVKFAESMGGATSSTAQDLARKRQTEVDALNGVIVRRGRELGVSTPVNHALTALIKLIEAGF
ncbi:MAG TPA: 2-dehydropantoate 2-reductase [Candidatus Acidoferrales bacterium]|nr:2-dehydropantoate 2-reductase [Candidatus Acidoferrales bacterium]